MGASGGEITFNTRYPFAKLDSENAVSFRIITLFFNTEPPNPSGSGSDTFKRTLIYSFPHGYNYTPSTWFMLSLDNFTSAFGTEGAYIAGGGDIPTNSSAEIKIIADASKIYFYVDKYYTASSGVTAPTIQGQFVTIRSYAFVNDLSGSDVPTHA